MNARGIPLAPVRGLADARPASSLMCLTLAWALDDAALGPRPRELPRPARARRGRRRPRRVHRRQGRLGPLADLSDRRHLRRADRAAAGRGLVAFPGRRVDRRALPATATLGRPRLRRHRHPQPGVDDRSTSTTSSSSGCSSGRPRCSRRTRSSAITGRSAPWSSSACSSSGTWRSPSTTSCRYLVAVQRRLALPADPVARLRRAVGVAAPPDRRSGVDLVGLPARRDGVHRRRRRGVVRPHPDGGVGAAGRRLGRRRGRPDEPLAVALAVPADGRLDPPARAQLRPEHRGRSSLDDQWRAWPSRSSATRPTTSDYYWRA